MSEMLQRQSLADLAVEGLLRLIESRQLAAGDALPSTAELAEAMGVSRTIVREAIAELAGQGLLDRRQGRETLVTLPAAKQLARLLQLRFAVAGADYQALEEYREILETSAARLAAERMQPEDVPRLKSSLQAFIDAETDDEMFNADQEFHQEIARTARNEMLLLALESTNSLLIELRRRAWAGWISAGNEVEPVKSAHAEILQRVLEGDGEAAAQAMQVNLNQARTGLESLHGARAV